MNKGIFLVMKWLDDKNSVSAQQRKAAIDAAHAVFDAYDSDHAVPKCFAAYLFAVHAAHDAEAVYAEEMVNEYFKVRGENKKKYSQLLTGI